MALKSQSISFTAIFLVSLRIVDVLAQNCPYSISFSGQDCGKTVVTAPGCKTTISVRLTNVPANQQNIVQIRSLPTGATLSYHVSSPTDLNRLSSSNLAAFSVDVMAIFEWVPDLSTAGRTYSTALYIPDRNCASNCNFALSVQKCRYCLQDRDSLDTLAALFGRHWTQIWSSNLDILSPDNITAPELGAGPLAGSIALGNTYRCRFGDTWRLISARFGIPVDLLQRLNPDLTKEVGASAGGFVTGADLYATTQAKNSLICIMPETCPMYRPPVPGISW